MNRKAIITGGSTGIGRAAAVALAKSGHDIAITYASNRDEAIATAKSVQQLGSKCVVEQLDLSNPESALSSVDAMASELGGLDVVVSNAGMKVDQKLPNVDLDSARRLFNINTFGAMMVAQASIRHLLPNGMDGSPRSTPGRLIFVTSVHEAIASPVDTVYTMSKHALGGLVKCLTLDLSPMNITVNSVAPGEIATPMNDMAAEEFDQVDRPAMPVRRAGHPDEVAAVIDFLAGETSSFVTGARWVVDGGFEAATPLAASGYRDQYLA